MYKINDDSVSNLNRMEELTVESGHTPMYKAIQVYDINKMLKKTANDYISVPTTQLVLPGSKKKSLPKPPP